jgi:hypothetical protein
MESPVLRAFVLPAGAAAGIEIDFTEISKKL